MQTRSQTQKTQLPLIVPAEIQAAHRLIEIRETPVDPNIPMTAEEGGRYAPPEVGGFIESVFDDDAVEMEVIDVDVSELEGARELQWMVKEDNEFGVVMEGELHSFTEFHELTEVLKEQADELAMTLTDTSADPVKRLVSWETLSAMLWGC